MNISILMSRLFDNVDVIYDVIAEHINPYCDKIIYNENIDPIVFDIANLLGIDICYKPELVHSSIIIYEDDTYEIYDIDSRESEYRQLPTSASSVGTVAV